MTLLRDQISIYGGLSNKPYNLKTLEVNHTDPTTNVLVATSFVEVNKNSEWFLKLVGGIACHKGGCKAVRILDDLYGEI